MEESYKIRKDRVKNIAIIFLTVMLVLTFFSNSILNRSLPEVATSYIERGTITEKIRGNGIVEAQDPYKIVATGNRKIASVPIKEGDMVTKDQILFQLEDAESQELKDAEKALDELIFSYTSALLNGEMSNESFNTVQSGKLDSINGYQAQIEAARQKVKACQATVDNIKRQQLLAANDLDLENTKDLSEATKKLELAKNQLTEAEDRLSKATKELDEILKSEDGTVIGLEALKAEVASKNAQRIEAEKIYIQKKKALLDSLKGTTVDQCFVEGEAGLLVSPDKIRVIQKMIDVIPETDKKDKAQKAFEELFKKSSKTIESNSQDNQDSQDSQDNTTLIIEEPSVYEIYANAIDESNHCSAKLARYDGVQKEKNEATNIYNEAKANCENWKRKVDELSGEIENDKNEDMEYEHALNINLADAETALQKAKDEQAQLLMDVGKELDLSNQNSIIADKQKEIRELREKTTGATIVSPVDGMILSVSKVAGEETAADEEIATIQVAGKDMMVSFPVTKQQAAKVKVGDKASLQNNWYYEGVEVTLHKIKPDKDNPSKNKILEFLVKGDVQNGESLGLEIGQRSKDYDHVVPNSAIREDKKGKFILIIEEKATPFGNRYKAKRYNVEVLASDETNSAIGVDGELQGWEYVITTSNIPVESGSQVRLAEY